MGAAGSERVRRCSSIAEIDPVAWDRLAERDVYARYGWLQCVEQTVADALKPLYFLLESEGVLAGVAVCYEFAEPMASPVDALLFGRLRAQALRLGITAGPVLACMPLIGQGRHVLWRRGAQDPDRVIRPLLDAISDYADAEHLSLTFAKLPDDEKELLSELAHRGFARTINWPVAYIDIQWDSFDGYLAGLAPGMASKVRRERAAPGKSGISFSREAGFAGISETAFRLVENNHRSYSDEPFGIAPDFFASLANSHPGESVVTVAHEGEAIMGVALMLTAGDCAGGPLIGVASDRVNRKAFTYFNLALYAPIQWCIEHDVRRLYLGAGLYEMKQRRGCEVLGLAMLIRHRTATGRGACRLLCALHRLWAGRKLSRQNVRGSGLR